MCNLATFIAMPCWYPNARTNKIVISYKHYHLTFATGGKLHSKGTFAQFQVQMFLQPIFFSNLFIPCISVSIFFCRQFATTVSPEMYKCKYSFQSAICSLWSLGIKVTELSSPCSFDNIPSIHKVHQHFFGVLLMALILKKQTFKKKNWWFSRIADIVIFETPTPSCYQVSASGNPLLP